MVGRVMAIVGTLAWLQLGAASTDRLVVIRFGVLPAEVMTQISTLRLRVAAQAMDSPSGDQAGLVSFSLDVVIFLATALEKFGFPLVTGAVIVQMFRSLLLSLV